MLARLKVEGGLTFSALSVALAAVALGYEAAFRIGEAVNPSHYYFFHPTGTAATFGAAAAAGHRRNRT